jgi:OFA family oxalate/formate antiporter-like MFS transporter
MDNSVLKNRWSVVAGAVLIQLALGAIYAWSVFTPGLIAEGWTKLQTQIVFSLGLVSFAGFMVFAGRRLKRWGPQKLTLWGGVTLGLGYILAGLLGSTNFWLVTICIGLISGAGIGLAYVVPIAVGIRWFPDKKGMITGLTVAGFGFGALGWVKLAGSWGHLIENQGLATTFILYGVLFAAMVIIGAKWMVMPPEEWQPPGYEPPKTVTVKGKKRATGTLNYTYSEMLKTPQFYLIFLTFVFSAGAGLMAIGLMKLYPMEALQAAGVSAAKASAIAGTAMAVFFSLANGLGRIMWGWASDHMRRRKAMIIMTGTQGLLVIAFTFLAGNEYLLYAAATLIGFNYGGAFALFPAITADFFGGKNVGQNYPYIFLAYGVGGIFGPVIGGALGDLGNFGLAFTITGLLVLVSTAIMWFIQIPHKTDEEIAAAVAREELTTGEV